VLAASPEAPGDVPEQTDDGGFEHRTIERLTIAEAVARLGARDRELIALRYGADLSAAQIGERLGLRPNAAEVAIHRALARLRTYFEQPSGEDPAPAPVRFSTPVAVSLMRTTSGSTGEET